MSRIVASVLTLFVVLLVACVTAPSPPAGGELRVEQLNPDPKVALSESSVFTATVEYRLVNELPRARYEITPMFGDVRGPGYTFTVAGNSFHPISLSLPEGRVEVRYPLASALRDPRMATPVEVWIFLIETTDRSSRVVAKAGPFEYPRSAAGR